MHLFNYIGYPSNNDLLHLSSLTILRIRILENSLSFSSVAPQIHKSTGKHAGDGRSDSLDPRD